MIVQQHPAFIAGASSGRALFRVRAINALAVALVAAVLEQTFHEACHGVAAVLVGARWTAFNLFAADHAWSGAAPRWGELIIAGNAALLNILCGVVAVILFSQRWVVQRPFVRLFVMYFGAYSLFAGFGYVMIDPLFYTPGNPSLGDWQKVVGLLGGSWAVRLPLTAIGSAGVLWGFFWLAQATLHFGEPIPDQPQRVRLALPLLIVPYVAVNLLFTILAFWNCGSISTDMY